MSRNRNRWCFALSEQLNYTHLDRDLLPPNDFY